MSIKLIIQVEDVLGCVEIQVNLYRPTKALWALPFDSVNFPSKSMKGYSSDQSIKVLVSVCVMPPLVLTRNFVLKKSYFKILKSLKVFSKNK